MKTLPRVPSVMRGQIFSFFFLMVSEQVNLIHERRPYGEIEKKYQITAPYSIPIAGKGSEARSSQLVETLVFLFNLEHIFIKYLKPNADLKSSWKPHTVPVSRCLCYPYLSRIHQKVIHSNRF